MASIRERINGDGTKAFSVQVRLNGYPARTATFATKREAERWATTIKAEMIEGRHFKNAAARRHTLGHAIDRYVLEELPKKKSGENARSALPWWKEKIGHLKLSDVTADVIVEHRNKLAASTYQRAKPDSPRSMVKRGKAEQFQRAPATVNRFLAVLSHVFTVCRKEWRWMDNNPMTGVSKLKEGKGRVRHLSEDERKRLLAETAKDPVLHLFVVTALGTACRAGELLKLRWSDVDLKEGQMLFRDTKNSEPRTAWLHGEALRLMKERAKVRNIKNDLVFPGQKAKGKYQYHKLFVKACTAANVHEFRFHDLRHTAATTLARLGATEQQLKAVGGWKSGVVSRYVHLASNDAKALSKKMNKTLLGD